MFEFFIENKLISSSQSGFKRSDSYINQLLFYYSWDIVLLMKALKLSIMLDIAKAFDKVWHDVSFLN